MKTGLCCGDVNEFTSDSSLRPASGLKSDNWLLCEGPKDFKTTPLWKTKFINLSTTKTSFHATPHRKISKTYPSPIEQITSDNFLLICIRLKEQNVPSRNIPQKHYRPRIAFSFLFTRRKNR